MTDEVISPLRRRLQFFRSNSRRSSLDLPPRFQRRLPAVQGDRVGSRTFACTRRQSVLSATRAPDRNSRSAQLTRHSSSCSPRLH